MSWSKPVMSSNISEVGWDDDTKELVVVFNNGRVYAYQGSDEAQAAELSNAASVGQMFNSQIKNRYPFRRKS